MTCSIVKCDAIEFLRSLPAGSVDLVFGSPPYEQARLYLENGEDMGIARNTESWVAWMVEVYKASLHACKGLVAFVVEGQTRGFRYSCGPALLMADLHRAGITLRKPPVFHRVGIPGSGGPDWLRNDWEWIICATNGGKLPWSDNTACGHVPKWAPGGDMSYRNAQGDRKNAVPRVGTKNGDITPRRNIVAEAKDYRHKERYAMYIPPEIANPGNVIDCGAVGGGNMSESPLVHENEAPFPEKLAEFFVQSFCPPSGTVCDPFSGSGTTATVSVRHGRRFTGCDIRQSQVDLGLKRVAQETPMALFGG